MEWHEWNVSISVVLFVKTTVISLRISRQGSRFCSSTREASSLPVSEVNLPPCVLFPPIHELSEVPR